MKLLIIGDIHLFYEKAERICRNFKDCKIIFVGDYFDQFNDSPEENEWCAEWLKESLKKPNRIHLRGNHDEQYDPRVDEYCSGFSVKKKQSINKILSVSDWDKLGYFHHENNWWISHAGITEYWFMPPIQTEITDEIVQKTIDDAIINQRMGASINPLWAVDYFRGGDSEYGGILWVDWRNLPFIKGMNQIVGHTPIHKILVSESETLNCTHINVDCSAITKLQEVLMIDENGEYSIINTSDL